MASRCADSVTGYVEVYTNGQPELGLGGNVVKKCLATSQITIIQSIATTFSPVQLSFETLLTVFTCMALTTASDDKSKKKD